MFDTITVRKITTQEMADFIEEVRFSGVPYFEESVFERVKDELDIYAAYNEQGFCGTVAVRRDTSVFSVDMVSLVHTRFVAHRILGAYAPTKNHVHGLVPVLANCVLHELSRDRAKTITAVILGQRGVKDIFDPQEMHRCISEEDYGESSMRGHAHKGAITAQQWAEKNAMTCTGFDPLTLGPIYTIAASKVEAGCRFKKQLDGSFIIEIVEILA